MEIADISQIPIFNQDLEGDKTPDSVLTLKKQISESNAVLFCCPEYNYSIPGVLKNAIDWASRGVNGNAFAGKAAGVMSAGGGNGGSRAQYHLRQIGVFLDLHFLNKPEVTINWFAPPQVSFS